MSQSNQKLCLNMIVKNEENNVTKCFDSILKYIDYYVISDTGSTDNTISVIKTYFDEKGIEGIVTSDDWVDFGTNRTIALNHARKKAPNKHVFIMDADDYLDGELILPENNEYDSIYLTLCDEGTDKIYKRQLILKNSSPWKFICPVHEYAFCEGKPNSLILQGEYKIISCRKGTVRNVNNPNRVPNDIKLLQDFIQTDAGKEILTITHSLYHISALFYEIRDYEKAIEFSKQYITVCETNKYPSNLLWYIHFFIGKMCFEKGIKTNDELLETYQWLVKGYNLNPTQNESLILYGELLIKRESYEKALEVITLASKNVEIPINLFFVDVTLYGASRWSNLINSLKLTISINNNVSEWKGWKFHLFMESPTAETLLTCGTMPLLSTKSIADRLTECSAFNMNGVFKMGRIKDLTLSIPEKQTFSGLFIKTRKLVVINLGNSVLTDGKNHVPFTNENTYGSELSAIGLAKQLSAIYDVFVTSYDNINKPIEGLLRSPIDEVNETTNSQVVYCHHDVFEKYIEETGRVIDVLILSRYINYFVDYAFKANKIFLWLHDTEIGGFCGNAVFKNKSKCMLQNIKHNINKTIVLSDWHRAHIQKEYGIEEKDLKVIGYGINGEMVDLLKKIAGKFIWTSDLSRGIERAIEYFHLIRKRMPNAELHIFRAYGGYEHLVNKWDYVIFYGKVSNERVAEEFKTSTVWFYPTHFLETFCLTALEAQKYGCLCVATNIGSLTNVVADRGYLFEFDVMNNKEKCVSYLLECLEKDNSGVLQKGFDYANGRNWLNVKREWVGLIEE